MTKRTGTMVLAFLLAVTLGLGRRRARRSPRPPPQGAKPRPKRRPGAGNERSRRPRRTPPAVVESTELPADVREINARGYLKDAFFDYDKSDLRDDARTALAADADWLKKYRTIQFLIEGHCDERGTSEYNLALGDRRANAAKEYLVSLGVDASRIRTVSYGKERPFCNESTEDCWQQNRRAHFLVTAR